MNDGPVKQAILKFVIDVSGWITFKEQDRVIVLDKEII